MRTAFKGGAVLVAGTLHQNMAVVMEDDTISALIPADLPHDADTEINITGHTVVPGYIDVQVNGGGGVLLNDSPTVEGIRAIAEAHRQYGTTGMLPTLISDDLDVVAQTIAAVDAAIEAGVPGILGVHIEGPFLNVEKKGVHDASKFRQIDDEVIDILAGMQHGVTHLTLAPECTTPDMISRLVESGVIVSAGHTNASYETTCEAVAAGMTGFTHLYNAMSALTSRAPGVVGAALDCRDTYAGIIADGFHVHPASLRAAVNAKGPDHIMLVTDAMPSVGAKDKNFVLQGQQIFVEDGRCTTEGGTLAGSDLDMASAVRNAVSMLDVPLETAVQMASTTPARFLGMDKVRGDIKPGMKADMVLLDSNHAVRACWIGGERYDATENR